MVLSRRHSQRNSLVDEDAQSQQKTNSQSVRVVECSLNTYVRVDSTSRRSAYSYVSLV